MLLLLPLLAARDPRLRNLPEIHQNDGRQASRGESVVSKIPLIQALYEDDVDKAYKLIEEGADVTLHDDITPLYAAQEYVNNNKRRHAMIKKLLKMGAPPDQETMDGSTTLMLAAYAGDVRSVQMLLDAGADPLKTNQMVANSINAAHKGGHHELAEQILEHVGESGTRHVHGRTPEKVEL